MEFINEYSDTMLWTWKDLIYICIVLYTTRQIPASDSEFTLFKETFHEKNRGILPYGILSGVEFYCMNPTWILHPAKLQIDTIKTPDAMIPAQQPMT